MTYEPMTSKLNIRVTKTPLLRVCINSIENKRQTALLISSRKEMGLCTAWCRNVISPEWMCQQNM